jgi:hypothetical protein
LLSIVPEMILSLGIDVGKMKRVQLGGLRRGVTLADHFGWLALTLTLPCLAGAHLY